MIDDWNWRIEALDIARLQQIDNALDDLYQIFHGEIAEALQRCLQIGNPIRQCRLGSHVRARQSHLDVHRRSAALLEGRWQEDQRTAVDRQIGAASVSKRWLQNRLQCPNREITQSQLAIGAFVDAGRFRSSISCRFNWTAAVKFITRQPHPDLESPENLRDRYLSN